MKLNHTDNGNGQIAIIDEKLRCIAFVPKLHPDSEKYIKLFENAPEMLDLLDEAMIEIEYLQSKFKQTGTGNSVISRIDSLIKKSN